MLVHYNRISKVNLVISLGEMGGRNLNLERSETSLTITSFILLEKIVFACYSLVTITF